MKKFYIIKKAGHEDVRAESFAGAYEAYDSLGKTDVTVEEHFFDTDAFGDMKHYVHETHKIRRRMLNDGSVMYYYKWTQSRVLPLEEELRDKMINEMLHELVDAGFTQEAKDRAITEAESLGVSGEIMCMIQNVIPIG